MITAEEQVATLSETELDAFPHGIIRLDRSGKVLYYNDAAAKISRVAAAQTVGRNFFGEVAPCLAVKNFQGRYDQFIATSGDRIEQFTFLFRFSWGNKEVKITLVRRTAKAEEDRVYIVLNAKSVQARA